jgi:4-carboxymuconolactone decarboxylase
MRKLNTNPNEEGHMKKTITVVLVILCIYVVWDADGKGGNAMADNRFEQGYQQMKKTNPDGTEQVLKSLSGVAPDMARFLVAFAYGDIYSRPVLDARTREIATIAIFMALGSAQSQLKWHINAALNVGVTPQEIIETIYVQTVYSGFPAGLNAIFAARDVFKERKVDFKPTKLDNDKVNRRERGLRTLDETSKGAGMKVVESMADIAPDMADFLIDFSYGTIFCRKILTPQLKEIIAIAGMTAAGTMKPQLQVHIKAALNVGLTREQIIEVMTHTTIYAGFPAALSGISAAKEVFAEKK